MILNKNIFSNHNDIFTYSFDKKEDELLSIDDIILKKGGIYTLYNHSGIGASFFSSYLASKFKNPLIINTTNDFRVNKYNLMQNISLNNNIEDILSIINIAGASSSIDCIVIDKINTIVHTEEFNNSFSSDNNRYPSFCLQKLLKSINYLTKRYKITFILLYNTKELLNKSNSILESNSDKVFKIEREKYLYSFGECIGYKLSINKEHKYNLYFNNEIKFKKS